MTERAERAREAALRLLEELPRTETGKLLRRMVPEAPHLGPYLPS
jgi:acyl-coenzyme A synthetase/AMP-(fatty) acid ligase